MKIQIEKFNRKNKKKNILNNIKLYELSYININQKKSKKNIKKEKNIN